MRVGVPDTRSRTDHLCETHFQLSIMSLGVPFIEFGVCNGPLSWVRPWKLVPVALLRTSLFAALGCQEQGCTGSKQRPVPPRQRTRAL